MKTFFSQRLTKCIAFTAFLFAMLFIFPTAIEAYAVDKVIPGGRTTGIMLHSEGAVITGFTKNSPAKEEGLKVGDIIVSIDEQPINSKQSLAKALSIIKDDDIDISVVRNGSTITFEVEPVYNANKQEYSIGTIVKDTIAGIGTITFIDPITGKYGALGHGICDPDTMSLIPFSKGTLMPSTVISVDKGKEGDPGELIGSYDMSKKQGSVDKNTSSGIFGTMVDPKTICGAEEISVADPDEIKQGKAYILSNIEGDTVSKYDIKIVDINNKKNDNRQMLIEITDPALLQKTGGIVQGMSGSPIIQNGKLVGAVTHVLVNDPTKGYGIFIENMLNSAA